MPDEQDVFDRLGVTDADFEQPTETPAEIDGLPEPVADAPQQSDGPARTADGRFAPKEAPADTAAEPVAEPVAPPVETPVPDAPKFEAPARLSADAKAAWDQAPLPVRAEITRAFGELEKGIAQYRDQIAPFQGFFDQAKRSNVDPLAMVQRYVEIDAAFTKNPMEGFEFIAKALGTDMRTIAAQIMGQHPPERDATVAQLQRENAELRQKAASADTYMQRESARRRSEMERTVADFWEKHPDAEQHSQLIQRLLSVGIATDLPSAYAYAKAFTNSAAPLPQTQVAAPPAAQPQTPPAANLSIGGSPSSGSNPATRVSRTKDASIDWALSQAGI